ncbi:MAG: glycosyltransferase family 39 protein [Alphaproteobacteria bacterium]
MDTRACIAAAVGVFWVVLAAFWAIPGVFGGDGLIYRAMIDAFLRNGSLLVENGYDFYPSPALAPVNMVVSGGRLVPQYPGGWGILAAPAYLAGGVRGVILVNVVASALTLPLIWLAASALFGDRRVAATAALIYALATFAVDYALAFWPHGITTFLVTAAFAATARGWRGTHHEGLSGLLVAGLAIGLAINIRVDAILAAAAIGAWTMGTARRPYATLGVLVLGLLPGLAAAAAINHAKFGSLSPFSYGRSSGGVSLSSYAELLPVLAVAGIAFLALGLTRIRATAFRPGVQAAIFAAALAAILLLPSLRDLAERIAQGFYVLVIDLQAHPVPGRGVFQQEDGTILMFGTYKKALLQSLPYAVLMVVLAPRLIRGPDRAPLAFCVLFMLAFIAFFSVNTWHGGASNNMRYFLNIVPIMAMLSALALREISNAAGRWPAVAVVAEVALLAAVFAYVSWRGFSLGFAIENTLPIALVMAIALLSVVFLVSRRGVRAVAASALRGLAAVGLVTAFISVWFIDIQVAQNERRINTEMAGLANRLPADALVMTFITSYAGYRLNQPPAMTAKADYATRAFDAGLVAHAFANGRPVYAQSRRLAEAMVETGAAGAATPMFGIEESKEFFRMAPPGAG